MTADVSVLGCGLMGSALARALARAEKSVIVWNRTPAKAQALAGPGIRAAATLDEATTSAPVALVCLTTYGDVTSTLSDTSFAPGATLVNVGSGAPEEARELERWAAERGLGYLDGAIFAYPADIDASGGQIAFAGAKSAWERHVELLGTLAPQVLHVSEDAGGAAVLDVGVAGAFYLSALTAFVESVSYTTKNGVSPEAVLSVVGPVAGQFAQQMEEAVRAISSGSFETDQATLAVYAGAARAAVGAMRDAGQAARMLGAASESLDAAEEAGLGDLGIFALHKVSSRSGAGATSEASGGG